MEWYWIVLIVFIVIVILTIISRTVRRIIGNIFHALAECDFDDFDIDIGGD